MEFSFDLNKILWDRNLSWSEVGGDTSVPESRWERKRFLRLRDMPVYHLLEKFLIEY